MKKKIKKDRYGLYIQTNANIYRPQKSKYSYISVLDMERGDNTSFNEREEVDVLLRAGSFHIKVIKNTKYYELWHSHGFKGIGVKTFECWNIDE